MMARRPRQAVPIVDEPFHIPLFISPTEPPRLRAIGTTSSLPEKVGVDVMWIGADGTRWGVQRKEVSDFLASRADGRLAKELGQMHDLDQAVVLIEGPVHWSGDDKMLTGGWSDVDRHQWHGMLWSIRMHGYWVEFTDSLPTTVKAVQWLAEWSQKDRHSGMRGRPKPIGDWGAPTDKEWGVHVLTSIDGIGPGLAAAIFDHFGRVPMMWDVSGDELLQVKGLGPKRVEALTRTIGVAGE